ncbi:MAG: LysR family transcriptional regulator [Parasporobacterium sp.]|nr:LysR family transcriptional regulator [Parasporobacterium sp.]
MYDISIQQLIYFITVAEFSNFSQAADHMYIAQPVLSKQISKLEKSLGVKLFNRVYHGVVLTDAGSHLYNACLPIIDELCKNIKNIQTTWGNNKKILSVYCLNTFQTEPFLMQNILRFKNEFPHYTFSFNIIEINDIRKAFADKTCDVCIAPEFMFDGIAHIYKKIIKKLPVYINIARNHPLLKKHKSLTLFDCKDETFCMMEPDEEGSIANQMVLKLCQYSGFLPNKIQYTKNLSSRETAVLLGAVSIGSGFYNSDKILQIPIISHVAGSDMTIAWSSDNKSEELMDFIGLFVEHSTLKIPPHNLQMAIFSGRQGRFPRPDRAILNGHIFVYDPVGRSPAPSVII